MSICPNKLAHGHGSLGQTASGDNGGRDLTVIGQEQEGLLQSHAL